MSMGVYEANEIAKAIKEAAAIIAEAMKELAAAISNQCSKS